jgi:serine O-acetyltransferase
MPAQRKYPDELRERAVKMVFEVRERDGKGHGEIARNPGSPVSRTPTECSYAQEHLSSMRLLHCAGATVGDAMTDGPPESTVAQGMLSQSTQFMEGVDRCSDARRTSLRRRGQGPATEGESIRAACVCEGGRLHAAFRQDLDRYVFGAQRHQGQTGPLLPFRTGLLSQGLWATTAYRWNHYARHRGRSWWLRMVPHALHRTVMALTGIHIDASAHIGPGLAFPHGGHIVIGPVRLGRNCDIYQGVTLGASMSLDDRHPRPGVPTLGDRVLVGPGAVIAGNVTVGDDAAVGAISLVVRDVPPRGVVVGVPARLVSRWGSFAQISYRGMDIDDERNVALAADPEAGPGRAG